MPKVKKVSKAKPRLSITKKKKIDYRYLDEYKDIFSRRLTPAPMLFIEKLASQVVEWAYNDEEALILDYFWIGKGIPTTSIVRWRKKHPELNEAFLLAKNIIGMRREVGGLTRKLDGNMVSKTAANYSVEWKELEEWRSNLNKKDEKSDTSNITFVLEQFPDSKLVPKKQKEE